MLFKFIYFAVILNIISCKEIGKNNVNYCLSEDSDPYLKFGAITSYNVIENNPESFLIAGYDPVQIWIMSRHGSRDASPDVLENMKKVLNIKDKVVNTSSDVFCHKDLEALKDWNWNSTVESHPFDIHEQGWKDLKDLAVRYQKRFPNLLGGNYSAEDFYFRHTNRDRTQHSCEAFVDGLFGDGSHNGIKIEEPLIDDIVLRSYYMCEKWKKAIRGTDVIFPEEIFFLKSDKFIQLKSDVSERFGFEDELGADLILAMHDNCRYDKTKYPQKISPWCALFSKDQLLLLEYYNDIYQFYQYSNGYEDNYKLGCFPLKHMRETFEKTIDSGIAKPKTTAMFTHEIMFDMVYSALNFTKDQKLPGKNYDDILSNRDYRTSINTPFACNIAAILYKSNIQDNKYKAQILLNEKPWEIGNCQNGICDWDELNNYLSFTRDCSLSFCNN